MNRFKNNIFWASVWFAQILFFYWISQQEKWIIYHEYFFEFQKKFHQIMFSVFPFSVGDIVYLILIFLVIRAVYRLFKRKRTYFLIGLNVFYFVYQLFWGLLYFQPPLKEKFSVKEVPYDKIESLTFKYLELCKATRLKVSEDEKGVFKINNLDEVEQYILKAQSQFPEKFQTKSVTNINVFKPSLFSILMSYTGILGYYNPFTTEAQYNAQLPDSYLPFTIAHESAHQLGIAREQEAHFIGYLIGKDSENIDLKYSTYWFVLKALLHFQIKEKPVFVQTIINLFSDEMKRDFMNEQKFYEEHTSWAEIFFSGANDAFLKSNQQEGIVTYGYFIDLFLLYETEK